jgi:hypothetical protein
MLRIRGLGLRIAGISLRPARCFRWPLRLIPYGLRPIVRAESATNRLSAEQLIMLSCNNMSAPAPGLYVARVVT